MPRPIHCVYCSQPPDGPMLYMGSYLGIGKPSLAHVACVVKKLNELLDPDWEVGCGRDPDSLVVLRREE